MSPRPRAAAARRAPRAHRWSGRPLVTSRSWRGADGDPADVRGLADRL